MEKKRSPKNRNNSQRSARDERMYYEQQREAQLIEDILNEFKNYEVDTGAPIPDQDLDTIEPEYGFEMPEFVKALFAGNTEDFDEKPVPTEEDFKIDPKIFEPDEEDEQPDEFEVNIDFEAESVSESEEIDFFAELFAPSIEDDYEPTTEIDDIAPEEKQVEEEPYADEPVAEEVVEEETIETEAEEIDDIPVIEESAGVDITTEDYTEEEAASSNAQEDDFYSTRELRTEFFTAEFDKKFREMFAGSLDDEDKKLGNHKMRSARVTHKEYVEDAKTVEFHGRFEEEDKVPVPRKKKKRKGIWFVMLFLFIGIFVFSGYQFLNTFLSQRNESNTLAGLADIVAMTESGDAGTVEVNGVEYNTDWEDENSEVLLKYQQLSEMNEDMIGWLKIPDTIIDYPVMYTPDDAEYYLHRDFFEEKSSSGMIFVDENCDIENGDNQIIYGHNMKNDSMFGTLDNYASKEFWEENQYIYYDSLYEERVYQVVCVFKARVLNKDEEGFRYYRFYGSETEEEFNEYVEGIKEMELYDTGIDISYGDKLITLSTCAYFTDEGRFVVVAKEIS